MKMQANVLRNEGVEKKEQDNTSIQQGNAMQMQSKQRKKDSCRKEKTPSPMQGI